MIRDRPVPVEVTAGGRVAASHPTIDDAAKQKARPRGDAPFLNARGRGQPAGATSSSVAISASSASIAA